MTLPFTLSIVSVAASMALEAHLAPRSDTADVAATAANPSPDSSDLCSDTMFTYRGWTGNLCDSSQNIDQEFTRCYQPVLKVDGTHSVSFDNYGGCKDIQCRYEEIGNGGRSATYRVLLQYQHGMADWLC